MIPLNVETHLQHLMAATESETHTPAVLFAPPASNSFDCADLMPEGAVQGHTCVVVNLIDALHLSTHISKRRSGQGEARVEIILRSSKMSFF